MPLRRARTPVEQLQPFERDRILGLREAGVHIDGLLNMLGTWSYMNKNTDKSNYNGHHPTSL